MTAGKLKTPAIAAAAAIGLAVRVCAVFLIGNFIFWSAVLLADSVPSTVDTSKYGEYTLYLQALGSPVWPFGPQDGRVVLKEGGRTICRKNFTLYNDGKNMNSYNWSVSWDGSGVTVTISGEEQPDEVIRLSFAEK